MPFCFQLDYLRRVGGDSPDRMVTRMLDALIVTNFQGNFNATGRDYSRKGRPANGEKISAAFLEGLVVGE